METKQEGGDDDQVQNLSPKAHETSLSSSLKQKSPLVYLKRRISGSKKRRDSGHSDGDYESVTTTNTEEDPGNKGPPGSEYSTGNRSLSLDSPQQLPSKEKPRRGIAKVFYDLKNRSKIRKSHSAPPSAMDSPIKAPLAQMDDDSFSSYATPMEAHSSGYSTPMFSESNVATPETSLTESFVEEDEADVDEEDTEAEATTVQNSPANQQVRASPQLPPSASEAPPLVIETVKQPLEETPPKTKPDCRQTPSPEERGSPPTRENDNQEPLRVAALSQHRASVPCSAKELQERSAASSSSVSLDREIQFCFTEYKSVLPEGAESTTSSPGRGFIRSLPTDPKDQRMESANEAASNGYPKSEHLYKVLVIGELGTGKTSIIKRYVHQFFSQHYRATIGVDFALKVVHWDQSTVIRLQLWDIAGQERFGNMTRVYYKEAVGAFIVFDVTRSSTFESVAKWKQDLDTKVQLPDGSPIPCVLLANKCDQPKEGLAANAAKMDEYCRDKGFAGWFETSAKDNINIDEAAKFLVGTILQNDQWSTSVREEDADKLELNGKEGVAASGVKKNTCC